MVLAGDNQLVLAGDNQYQNKRQDSVLYSDVSTIIFVVDPPEDQNYGQTSEYE